MNERARYRFTVSEYETNKFRIVAEPLSSDIKILKHGMLGFDLASEMSHAEVQQVVDFLNKNIRFISYSGLGA